MLADGVQLLGRFERSGHRNAPSMVRRADGQIIQVTPLLYAVLESIDGRRHLDQIAALVGERTGKLLGPAEAEMLVDKKLRPLGLLRKHDGTQPEVRKADPLLGLKLRYAISNPRVTRAIAAPFAKLFLPPVVFAFTIAFVVLTGWLFVERGIAPAVRQALYEPGLLLLVLGLATLSAGFHELGHAAACRYGGGRPGVMGVGLYLVWPAFYTDVTDAYRLGRRARLRVDLGGIYFNAIFAVASFGLWAATGWEALLAIIPLQLLAMVRQLVPLVRLDGYHILADLTGVPDLFAHIKPILAGLLPSNWGRNKAGALKPWVRVVVSTWVLVVVPLLAAILVAMVVTLPRLVATAWDSIGIQWNELTGAWADGDKSSAAVEFLSILAIAVPVLSIGYLLVRVARRLTIRVWKRTTGHPFRRGVAVLVAVGLIAGLVSAWWPKGQYTPIQAGERGRLPDLVAETEVLGHTLLSDSVLGTAETPVVPPNDPIELQAAAFDPAVVLTAQTEHPEAAIADGNSGFRFTLPEPPGEGDNQALAANYIDGSTLVAMALSFILSDTVTVANSNEAYALASCIKCMAAAIAFQLIVVLDEADVVVPENAAVAVTAYCVRCVTFALAYQIIVTLDEPLSAEAEAKLDALWRRLEALQKAAGKMPLKELVASVEKVRAQILGVLEEEGAMLLDDSDEETAESIDPTTTPTTDPSPTVDASPSTEPSPTPTSEPSPTEEPSPSPSSEPSPSSDPSPSPTSEPSPSTSP